MSELKKCPCGNTPKKLHILGQDRDKWAWCGCGECDWYVEFRNQYCLIGSIESQDLAKEAWNNAKREG